MLVISLWQPWCWSMSEGIKLIENRVWKPPASLLDQQFALHASKKWHEPDLVKLTQLLYDDEPRPPSKDTAVFGAVVSVCRLKAVVTSIEEAECFGGLNQGRFFLGPYGWVVEEMQKLPEPVPCLGRQGLRPLLGDVLTEVQRQVEVNA